MTSSDTATTVDTIDRAIAAATPRLRADERRLVAAIHRRLAAGQPAAIGAVAADAGVPEDLVNGRLAAWPGVFRDDAGDVVGFWGLAIPEMPHRISFAEGADVHAWCAWDPLFLAPIAGRARVDTADPVSGASISYVVDGDGIVDADVDQVLSFLEPVDSWGEDVLGSFCHFVHHFTGRETGERWVTDHPGTFLLTLQQAAELGRRHAQRIAGDARTRPVHVRRPDHAEPCADLAGG